MGIVVIRWGNDDSDARYLYLYCYLPVAKICGTGITDSPLENKNFSAEMEIRV
jgi:hypothetical protein